jgi:hypothetical protein
VKLGVWNGREIFEHEIIGSIIMTPSRPYYHTELNRERNT